MWYFTTSRTKKCKNSWYASAHTSCFLSMLGRPADCSEQTCWLGSAELLSLVATFQKQSSWTPYSISLNLIRRLLSLAQSYSSAYGVVFFSLRSRILRLTEPYPSACIVISFKILCRLVSFTQPFALALTGRLAGCYYILSIARDQEHWVLLSILEPHAKVLYNINKRSPWTYTLSTDFLEYNLNDWNLLLSKVFSHHWQTL